jgi:hypothetical protein
MFNPLPTFHYRVRNEPRVGSPFVTANLTRGTLNASETGTFLGFIHRVNRECVEVEMVCTTPDCDHRSFWQTLDELDEFGPANCDVCENPTTPVI